MLPANTQLDIRAKQYSSAAENIVQAAEIRRRLAPVSKPRVIIQPSDRRVTSPIRFAGYEHTAPSIRYEFDRAKAMEMFRAGRKFWEIAEFCDVPTERMRKLIRREGWKR